MSMENYRLRRMLHDATIHSDRVKVFICLGRQEERWLQRERSFSDFARGGGHANDEVVFRGRPKEPMMYEDAEIVFVDKESHFSVGFEAL